MLNGAVHVLVPEYVPDTLELLTPVATPGISIVQVGRADTPPAGTLIVKINVVPDSVPAKFPLN
ncbi:MAG: hypothetical protein ABMA15_19750 [Vicinamibacterales bacterium]